MRDAIDAGTARVMSGLVGQKYAWRAHHVLVNLIEARLRLIAAQKRRERPDRDLFPTQLIDAAYLRIARDDDAHDARAHYFGAAAEAMRRILVKRALYLVSAQGDEKVEIVTFRDVGVACHEPATDILALHEALSTLELEHRRVAEVARMRYFGGLTVAGITDLLSLSPATVVRDWANARARLSELMG